MRQRLSPAPGRSRGARFRSRSAGTAPEGLERRVLFTTTYDISGVGNASFDQPQIHVIFRSTPTGDPLGGDGPDEGYAIKAFLDTGTSASLLSQESAEALGLSPATYNGQQVQFYDVGVGGAEGFDVSDPIYGALAPVRSVFEDEIPVEDFNQTFGPVRTEIALEPSDDFFGPLEIIGMPALKGKVMVMDPRPLNSEDPSLLDSMRTYVYAPGTPFNNATNDSDPGIPQTNLHVKLGSGDFSRFTLTLPAGAPGPTFTNNPFIGSDPTGSHQEAVPGITIANGGSSATGNFLFDTGAAASFISTALAAKVHVHYQEGTYNTDHPVLVDDNGNPVPGQFTIPLGGVGGTLNAAGFRLSSLSLPTLEGTPLRFLDAPVLVADVTAEDPVTGQQLTLDGDFGMNFLVASIDVDDSSLGDSHAGAFDWVTYDQPAGVLGVYLPDAGPAAPSAPDLLDASDSGASQTDDLTNVAHPAFGVSGVLPGLVLQLLRDGQVVATTTPQAGVPATLQDSGTVPDGTHAYTVRQLTAGGTPGLASTALTVRIDTAAPVATIQTISATPRPFGVDGLTVTFSEPVAGAGLAGFSLTRDGSADVLAGSAATVTALAGGKVVSVGNLATLTAPNGSYVFTAKAPLADAAGNVIAATTRAFSVVSPSSTLTGTAGNDIFYLRRNPDGTHLDVWRNAATPGSGTPTQQILISTLTGPLAVAGQGGNDVVLLDFVSGNFLPAAGFGFDGGSGADTVAVRGTASADAWSTDPTGGLLTTTAAGFPAGGLKVALAGVEGLFQAGGTGAAGDSLAVTGGNWTVYLDDTTIAPALTASGLVTSINFAGRADLPGLVFVTPPPSFAAGGGATAAAASVRGTVFNDKNANGARAVSEAGLAGWQVYLDANRNGRYDKGEPTARTGAGGTYAFTGLKPGRYRVYARPPAGYRATAGAGGIAVTLAGGMNAKGKDFGMATRPAAVSPLATESDAKKKKGAASL